MHTLLAPGPMFVQPGGVSIVSPATGLGPRDVATALASGWSLERERDTLTLLPIIDGGPGSARQLPAQIVREQLTVEAVDALEESCSVDLVSVGERSWYLDAAAVAPLVADRERGAELLEGGTSAGIGVAIRAAMERISSREDTLIIGLARASVLDGGQGMIDAMGGVRAARELCAQGPHLVLALADTGALGGLSGVGAWLSTFTAMPAVQVQSMDRQACEMATRLAEDLSSTGARGSIMLPQEESALRVTRWGTGAGGGSAMLLQALGAHAVAGAQVGATMAGLSHTIGEAQPHLVVTAAGELYDLPRDGAPAIVGQSAAAYALPTALVTSRATLPRGELAGVGISALYRLSKRPAGMGPTPDRQHDVLDGDADALKVALTDMGARMARTWSRDR